MTIKYLALGLMFASPLCFSQSPPMAPPSLWIGAPATDKVFPAVDASQYPVAVAASTSGELVRTKAPVELFGFNLTWNKFQEGYWRNGRVRPEVVEWLKPFRGAHYRYPGGTDSNYFLWEESIGDPANRAPQQEKYGSWVKVLFGFDEYIEFVKQVGGKPMIVANLSGSHSVKWTPQQAAESNRRWLEYANRDAKNSPVTDACGVGSPCPVTLWELGNELDWEEKWTGDRYAAAVKVVGPVLRAADPAVHLLAHVKTAPWGDAAGAQKWNETIGNQLRSSINSYAFHPYYDGNSVSNIEKTYIDQGIFGVVKDPGADLYVTEHALWPYRPPNSSLAEWQQYWPTTGDMGGAISTADFLIMAMNRPDITASMWHSLGLAGPWQLFYVNSSSDQAYPNVVYWGMRALREAVLDQVIKSSTRTPNASKYGGGYDVRSTLMRDTSGSRYSLMTVNRSGNKMPVALSIPAMANAEVSIVTRAVNASGPRIANTSANPNQVTMKTSSSASHFGSNGVMTVEVPAYSVMSFVISRK